MGIYSSCKALVIGVGCYADPQYDLSYARSDAEAMAEMLGNEFGFDQVWTLYDNDATRQSIIRFFEQDLQRIEEDDGLLIFFAGHGITVTSAIGDDRGFLVPHDGDPKERYRNISLASIRDDYLPNIPAKHVFLIVDACYGGLALRDVATIGRPQTIDDSVLAELTSRDHKVRQVLAAGTKDQKVLDGGLFGHSVFTGRLIEALREANPYITADHIGVHVRERVARDGADRHHPQTPQFGLLHGGQGSFVFFRKSAASRTGSPKESSPVKSRTPPVPAKGEPPAIGADEETRKAKQRYVNCHICGQRIKVPRNQAGASIDCPACGTALAAPKEGQRKSSLQVPGKGRELQAGAKLGTFVVTRVIKTGHMGMIYLAKQTSMGRMVAVKVLHSAMAQCRDHIKRFLAEVHLQANLDHPGIVPAFEAGFDNNVYFLAMAYVDGESLAAKMEREGTISESKALEIVLQVAEALAYVWDEHGMLHCDIKPSHIMIDKKGIVRLLDLGISKCISDNVTMRASDLICGTPVYMSPEQALGEPKLDCRCDIYSLGATLYHALTGEFPFNGQNAEEILYKHIHEPLEVPNGEFSPECSALICKMMKKQPAERHADWHKLIAEVRELLDASTVTVAAPTPAGAPPRSPVKPKPAAIKPVPKQRVRPETAAKPKVRPRKQPRPAVIEPVGKKLEKDTPWEIPELGMVLLPIKPGTFMMGSPPNEKSRDIKEMQHKVTLTQPFWLGRCEVMQAEYEAIMGENPSHFKGANRPVEEVSWDDAVEFCKKLTTRDRRARRLPRGCGYVYRLPTEAEWEYCCRAGTTTAYCFDNNARKLDQYAWYHSNSRDRTHEVGQKKPNAWGLYDMYGNVWEWCYDWYAKDYPRGAVTDPVGPAEGSYRVLRGGAWRLNAWYCRSAIRFRDRELSGHGFRLALAPEIE